MYKLIVREPFTMPGDPPQTFARGDEITDETLVAAILASEQSHHVVKVGVET